MVVSANLQPEDPVRLLPLNGKHQYCMANAQLPHLAARTEARAVRSPNVESNQVGMALMDVLEAFDARYSPDNTRSSPSRRLCGTAGSSSSSRMWVGGSFDSGFSRSARAEDCWWLTWCAKGF